MSKHFNRMWQSVVQAIDIAMDECDQEFVQRCNPVRRDKENLSYMAEKVYRRIRGRLRQECYGTKNGEEKMDARKMAAVMCCTMMEQQAVRFDAIEAATLMEEKNVLFKKPKVKSDRTEYNRWIVNNFFINYKIAYLTGLFIILDTLMSELLKNQNTVPFGRALAQQGQLSQYPKVPKVDGFDVSMVLGLGRAGMQRKPVDAFLLALQFYQIEMYTRKELGLDKEGT